MRRHLAEWCVALLAMGCNRRRPAPPPPNGAAHLTPRREHARHTFRDVDGDGHPDALVGHGPDSTGQEGAALWTLRPEGPRHVITWRSPRAEGHRGYAWAVALPGDLDGDARDDAVISAWHDAGHSCGEGRLYVHLGSANGPRATPDQTLDAPAPRSLFGSALHPVGDVNGDGRADLLVETGLVEEMGAYSRGPAGELRHQTWDTCRAGRVALYLGARGGLVPAARALDLTDLPPGLVWASLDADGDAFGDVVAAASGGETSPNVWLFRGNAQGLGPTAERAWRVGSPGDTVHALSAGDFNGDGARELAMVLAPASSPDARAGRVVVLSPRNPDASAALTTWDFASWGRPDPTHARALAADVNGDGRDDLVVASPGSGSLHVWEGGAAGLTPTSERTLTVVADLATRVPTPVLVSLGARDGTAGAELLVAAPTEAGLTAWVVRTRVDAERASVRLGASENIPVASGNSLAGVTADVGAHRTTDAP